MNPSNEKETGEDKSSLYNLVTEGKASVYFHKTKNEVFYNPIQEFNRDLSIAVINTYSAVHDEKPLRILEALAASGIRSMRYAHEIKNCREIVANDFDAKAVQLIDLNIELNKVADKVKSNCDDASALMHSMSKTKETQFDCIDLDPYGTPAPFLDSALRNIKDGGLLLVTATDAAVLCGNGADTSYTKYGALSLRTPCCHEMALRILLQSINSHAARHSKYIIPLVSLSIDFYFRVFVLVKSSQVKSKESVAKIGFFYVCSGCQSFFQQNFGESIPTSGNVKFKHAPGPPLNSNKCTNCEGNLHLAGPVWLGKLHDDAFLAKVIEHINLKTPKDYSTKARMLGMLNLASEELDDPLYYVMDEICKVLHCETPTHNVFRSAILNANYDVSYSHCNKNSVKTNAPSHVIWDILREWVKTHPVKDRWLTPDFRSFHLLKKNSEKVHDFTIRKEALPGSKKSNLLRFQMPPPFWGPLSRPKREATTHEESKNKKQKCDDSENQPAGSSLENNVEISNVIINLKKHENDIK